MMAILHAHYIVWALGILLLRSTWAQQLSGARTLINYPDLSTACLGALETNVSCPPFLSPISSSGQILDSALVTELCTDSCYTSLENAQDVIQEACTAKTDVIVYDSISYPATFIIDNFIHTYNVSCKTDSHTGAFCDPQFLAWRSQGYLPTTNQTCSDCWLGARSLQLNSPLGYDAAFASNFASLTSSCNATVGYGFTVPTPYALNSTSTLIPATATTTAAPICTDTHTVQATDDCNSVALANNVSTYNLLFSNNLDLYCQNFATVVNSTLCVPQKFSTYVWQGQDSCDSVTRGLNGVTVAQFLSWNPIFDMLCRNSLSYIGYVVCLSPPGGDLTTFPSSGSTTQMASSMATKVPAPTNAMNGTKTNCGGWYTVQTGDTCAQISVDNSLSVSQFYFLNPELTTNCTNLEVGEAYCVTPVGDLSTYSGYPVTTPRITVTPASFPSVNTGIPTSSSNPGFTATYAWMPHASDTVNNCQMYQNYTQSVEDCTMLAGLWGIDTKELFLWNPSLSSNLTECQLMPGLSYCVENDNATSK